MAAFDASWGSNELANALCDGLVESGKLKAKPTFIRDDRQAKLVEIFEKCRLDGGAMASFDNPGPLKQLIRRETEGEVWVDHVVAGLIGMLAPEVANAEERIEMDDSAKDEMARMQEKIARRQEEEEAKGGRKGGGGGGGGKGKGRDRDEGYSNFGGRDRGGGGGGGGRGQECYNCGQDGHMARDCEEPSRKGGGGKGGGGGRDRDRRGGGGDQECYNCGQMGHISRDCDAPRQPKGGGKGKNRRRDDDDADSN